VTDNSQQQQQNDFLQQIQMQEVMAMMANRNNNSVGGNDPRMGIHADKMESPQRQPQSQQQQNLGFSQDCNMNAAEMLLNLLQQHQNQNQLSHRHHGSQEDQDRQQLSIIAAQHLLTRGALNDDTRQSVTNGMQQQQIRANGSQNHNQQSRHVKRLPPQRQVQLMQEQLEKQQPFNATGIERQKRIQQGVNGLPNNEVVTTANIAARVGLNQGNEGSNATNASTQLLQRQLAMLQQQVMDMQQPNHQQQMQQAQQQPQAVQANNALYLPNSNVAPNQLNQEAVQQLILQNQQLQRQLLLQQQNLQNQVGQMPWLMGQDPNTNNNNDVNTIGAPPSNSANTGAASNNNIPILDPNSSNVDNLAQNQAPLGTQVRPIRQLATVQNNTGSMQNLQQEYEMQKRQLQQQNQMQQSQALNNPLSHFLNGAKNSAQLAGTKGDNSQCETVAKSQPKAAHPMPSKRARTKTFPEKLMQAMLDNGDDSIVAWLPDGKSFVVVDADLFCSKVLKESKYSSFVRKLHRWGFMRLTSGTGTDCFYHPLFQKKQKDLASTIHCLSRTGDKTASHQTFANRIASKPPSLAGVEKFIKTKIASATASETTTAFPAVAADPHESGMTTSQN
jgi:hypothetical protein